MTLKADRSKVKVDPPFCRKCNRDYDVVSLNPTSTNPQPIYACKCNNYGGPVFVWPRILQLNTEQINIEPYENNPVETKKEEKKKHLVFPYSLTMYDQVTTRCNYCGKLDSFYPMVLMQMGTKYNYPCQCGNSKHGIWLDWVKFKFGDYSYLWHKRNESFSIGGV